MRRISVLGATIAVAAVVAACGGGIPGNAVVQVGESPITKEAMDHWVKIVASSSAAATSGASKPVVPDPPTYKACIAHLRSTQPKPAKGQPKETEAQLKSQCEQQYTALKQQALGFLISANWLLGEAKSLKVSVPDAKVKKEFIKLKKQQWPTKEAYEKFLSQSGYTVSDLLLRVKLYLEQHKIFEQVTKEAKKKISKSEAQKYYNEHKSSYGQPERRNLRIILTKTEAQASSAKSEVEGGKSFASVAKSVSIDPVSKAKGGVLDEVRPGQEEKALDEAVFAAKTGVLSGPVKTPFGYYVFEVTKVLPGSQEAFSKVESSIKAQMASERQHKSLESFEKEYRKKWTAKTECRSGYVVQNCKNYKAPKTTTPPTTSVPTTSSTTSTSTTSTKTK